MVQPSLLKKLIVSSPFNNLTLMKDQYLIRIFYCGKPVGDCNSGSSSTHFFKGRLYKRFRFRINTCSSLIENKHFRFLRHRPGKRNELALAAGKSRAPFPNLRIVAIGKPFNKVVCMDKFRPPLLHPDLKYSHQTTGYYV